MFPLLSKLFGHRTRASGAGSSTRGDIRVFFAWTGPTLNLSRSSHTVRKLAMQTAFVAWRPPCKFRMPCNIACHMACNHLHDGPHVTSQFAWGAFSQCMRGVRLQCRGHSSIGGVTPPSAPQGTSPGHRRPNARASPFLTITITDVRFTFVIPHGSTHIALFGTYHSKLFRSTLFGNMTAEATEL